MKKIRLPRIERTPELHVQEEEHTWAVSYADFLMVLLSFFVLFFSVDQDEKQNIIQRIVSENAVASSGGGILSSKEVGTGAIPGGLVHSDFDKIAKSFQLKFVKNKKNLLIEFPENIYERGAIDLNSKYKKALSQLIKKLKPYDTQINITFIGHTDGRPVRHLKSRNIQNNFDLSVIRASRALQFAVFQGYSSDFLSAKGAAENQRNSRSLTIGISGIGQN